MGKEESLRGTSLGSVQTQGCYKEITAGGFGHRRLDSILWSLFSITHQKISLSLSPRGSRKMAPFLMPFYLGGDGGVGEWFTWESFAFDLGRWGLMREGVINKRGPAGKLGVIHGEESWCIIGDRITFSFQWKGYRLLSVSCESWIWRKKSILDLLKGVCVCVYVCKGEVKFAIGSVHFY